MTRKTKRTKRRIVKKSRTRKQHKYLHVRGGKQKKNKKTINLIDIGLTRPRVTGQPGMNQNLDVSRKLAHGMSKH